MEARQKKQLIIGGIFVLIFAGIAYGFIDYLFITETTCFDNIKNHMFSYPYTLDRMLVVILVMVLAQAWEKILA